jgi:hypothetical protein
VLDAAFTSFPRQVLAACWAACKGTEPDLLRGSLLFLREQLLPQRQALEDEAGRPTSLAASVLAANGEARAWLLNVLARPQKGAHRPCPPAALAACQPSVPAPQTRPLRPHASSARVCSPQMRATRTRTRCWREQPSSCRSTC